MHYPPCCVMEADHGIMIVIVKINRKISSCDAIIRAWTNIVIAT